MVNWKYIAFVIAIIAVIAVALLLVKRKGISFDFDMGGNLSSIFDLINGRYANAGNEKIGAYVTVPLTTKIKNDRRVATVLNNIAGSITYDGNPIIQTNAGSSALQNITVPGKTSVPVTDNVQLLINESSVKFLKELISGKNPTIKYNFSAMVKGKPYSFNKTTTLKKII